MNTKKIRMQWFRFLTVLFGISKVAYGFTLNVVNQTEEDLVVKLNTIAGEDETQTVRRGYINDSGGINPTTKDISKALMVRAVEVRSRFGKQILEVSGVNQSALNRSISVSYKGNAFNGHQDLKQLGQCGAGGFNPDLIAGYFKEINELDQNKSDSLLVQWQ